MIDIRTCIVSEWGDVPRPRLKPENECSFSDETLTHYIERDPVLDLLERAYNARPIRRMDNFIGLQLDEDMAVLLRAHGRLGGEA